MKHIPPAPPIPEPPATPKGGVHKHVDTASMAERAIDKARDAEKVAMHADDRAMASLALSQKHAEIIETIPAIHVKLDLALRPRPVHPLVQGALAFGAVVGTIAIVVLAFAAVSLARSPNASAVSATGTQAVYPVP